MGCWDEFCVICGNTSHAVLNGYDEDEENIITKQFVKNTKWLDKCTFLTLNNEIIHKCREVACNVEFTNGKKTFNQINPYSIGNFNDITMFGIDNCGIFVHTDCWKFVKQNYDMELKFGDLPIDRQHLVARNMKNSSELINLVNVKYDTEKYWGQDFDFNQVCVDSKQYLCMSPLKNKENATRIKKILNMLELRPGRMSPSISATIFKPGTIKIGSDSNFWIQNKGKWLKMSGKIVRQKVHVNVNDKKQMKMINTAPQIGDFSTKPHFIESFTNDYKKKELVLTIITLEQD